ncbi:hypothetical protein VNI00_006570 [Paramarasmius palmivorus]|uniref:Uncharacterized protein n=1 Tax=Paramarasmius palmivorus TaxID=297713 RepID=A0AAW0D9E0_9AGAR
MTEAKGGSRGWLSPPTRRELILLIFALATFSISYNLDASLNYLGASVDLRAGHNLLIHNHLLPSSRASQFHVLEHKIFGSFSWLPWHTANSSSAKGVSRPIAFYSADEVDPAKRLLEGNWWGDRVEGQEKKAGDYQVWPFNGFWMGVPEREALGWIWDRLSREEKREGSIKDFEQFKKTLGRNRVQDGFWRWSESPWDDEDDEVEEETGNGLEWKGPRSTIVGRVGDFAIIDYAFLYNGTVYIILDDQDREREKLQSPELAITGWELISTTDALKILGDFGGVIRGTSWIAMDHEQDTTQTTLLGLQRIQSSLSVSNTVPDRIIYPNVPISSTQNPNTHMYTMKAAYPHTGMLYREDWEDYVEIGLHETKWSSEHSNSEVWKSIQKERKRKPGWVFERVVVGFGRGDDVFLGGEEMWFDAPRNNLATFFGLEEKEGKKWFDFELKGRKRVAIVSTSAEDGSSGIAEVITPETPWAERMKVLLRTQVLICSLGSSCAEDLVWMPRGGVVVSYRWW